MLNENAGEVGRNGEGDSTHRRWSECHLFMHVVSKYDDPLSRDNVRYETMAFSESCIDE